MLHSNFTPHAFITDSNVGGIEIMLNKSNDGVFYRWNYGPDLSKEEIFEAEIQFDQEGEPYFMHAGCRVIYLTEAMKINHA